MKYMGLNDIRKAFLDFYKSKGHYVGASYPLVPQNDKSLLLVNAGMQPLKRYFMGIEEPPKERMATCQKCMRTGDIENVGITARHATFFEMLGNFSFGDYFKSESIAFGWEFLTQVLELPADKLWPSVFEDDDEAFAIWRDEIGLPENRITRLGREDNFWEIGAGPCGPCSEIYYDRGEAYGCGEDTCRPGCECERFMEIWNHVFTQFEKDEKGNYNPLSHPNIDTGMGLERIACVMQDVDSIFEIDTIKHILDKVVEMSGVAYGENPQTDISIRIITDHIKAVTFMVGDGIMPNNEGRGYVLRRILRRAARHARTLGMASNSLTTLVDAVIESYGVSYSNLVERQDYIKKIVTIEEERFETTIDQGLGILNEHIKGLKEAGLKLLKGQDAFELYDTYGFPLELTKEILEEVEMTVDEEGFNAAMAAQKERARTARGNGDELGWATDVLEALPKEMTSTFIGYNQLEADAKVLAIASDVLLDQASEGMEVTLILDQTTLYPEGGGQVGDKGTIEGNHFLAQVNNTKKSTGGRIAHQVVIEEGSIKVGDTVTTQVDSKRRLATARNHSMTHILQSALRNRLGSHVEQAGSYVTPDRLRFDFSHFESISAEDLIAIEKDVNTQIFSALPIVVEELPIEEAKAKGAMALFSEKYGDKVRVVTMGDYSVELCGGTHLSNTSEAGMFKIVSESGVAAGIRRVEAITGEKVYQLLTHLDYQLETLSDMLKTNKTDIVKKTENLLEDHKALQKENEQIKQKLAAGDVDKLINQARTIAGIKVITAKYENLDAETLRLLGDQIKDKCADSLIVLANVTDGSVQFIAMASEGAIQKGAHAGNIIREVAKVAGGGGGGRPNLAQAGGKKPEKVDEALSKVDTLLG